MITEEYFRQEYDRLIKLLRDSTDEASWWIGQQLFYDFEPKQGKEKLCAEVRFQLDVIETARALTYYNELIGKDPDDGCDRIHNQKQSLVLEAARGIQWQ
jgi:hypothetical protein